MEAVEEPDASKEGKGEAEDEKDTEEAEGEVPFVEIYYRDW
jgi:hypothetical protein